jgi:hypothetical protein
MHASLRRLHRIVLVVNGRSRAGEIVDLVDLQIDRECHVVADKLEALVINQMLYVASGAGEEVVEADDLRALSQQAFAEVRAQKTGPTGHQYTLRKMHWPAQSLDLQQMVKVVGVLCHVDFKDKVNSTTASTCLSLKIQGCIYFTRNNACSEIHSPNSFLLWPRRYSRRCWQWLRYQRFNNEDLDARVRGERRQAVCP